jgi:RNA polymerase sigma factor (sigma-70 family)
MNLLPACWLTQTTLIIGIKVGKIKKHYNDYTEQNILDAVGTTPLFGTLEFYWKDRVDCKTVDPETIEALIERDTAEDIYDAVEFKEVMKDILDSLTRRERKVLRLRFGIGMNHDHSLEEVGKIMDLSKERIRQLEAKALRKMRYPSRSCQLIDYTNR